MFHCRIHKTVQLFARERLIIIYTMLMPRVAQDRCLVFIGRTMANDVVKHF